jgi:methionyl-tRNA formyltransferase
MTLKRSDVVIDDTQPSQGNNILNVLFIGCVEFSEIALKTLLLMMENNVNVCGVVSKSQSNFNNDHVNLLPLALQNNIKAYDFKGDVAELEDFVTVTAPDVIYCFGWSHLLSDKILATSHYGVIGFHPTKLPMNRGRHPIIWTLALGLTETATTFFQMDSGADSGDIINQQDLRVLSDDNAQSLYHKICQQAAKQIPIFTLEIRDNKINPVEQDQAKASYWRKRSAADGLIDWRMSANSIYNLVRALSKPYCGAHFSYREKCYTVWTAWLGQSQLGNVNNEPGKVVKVNSKKILIQCGDNSTIWIENLSTLPEIEIGSFL